MSLTYILTEYKHAGGTAQLVGPGVEAKYGGRTFSYYVSLCWSQHSLGLRWAPSLLLFHTGPDYTSVMSVPAHCNTRPALHSFYMRITYLFYFWEKAPSNTLILFTGVINAFVCCKKSSFCHYKLPNNAFLLECVGLKGAILWFGWKMLPRLCVFTYTYAAKIYNVSHVQ